MINMETVKFIMMIDTLCSLSENGIMPLSSLDTSSTANDCIYYDDSHSIYNSLNNEYIYRAISIGINDDEYNEENNIFWDEYINTDTKYSVTVIVDEDEDAYVQVKCKGQSFVIKDGECFSF